MNCVNLTELDLSGFDTSNVTIMRGMFMDCKKLTSIGDVSEWNTSNLTDMRSLFNECNVLTSVNVGSWDTTNVVTMDYMFQNCKNLTEIDVSRWNTGNVTTMIQTFVGCSGLETLDVSGWDTTNVTTMEETFRKCSGLITLDVSGWNTENVTNMRGIFSLCINLTTLNVSGWNTENVTNMDSVFTGCEKLTSVDVSGWNTTNVEDMSSMFNGCKNLSEINVSEWDTTNVTNMNNVFASCEKLTSVDVSNWNTSNVTNMGLIFYECKNLSEINVSEWDTTNVTNMNSVFASCEKLTSVDVSGWDTTKVTNMGSLFNSCYELTSVDLSNFDTRKVEDMRFMFSNCRNLTSLDITNFDTKNVKEMRSMFNGCSGLTSIDISNFDMSSVINTTNMLNGCSGLTDIYTPKVYSAQVINLPSSDWYNVTNINDNNIYANFKNDTFTDTVHLRKLVDYSITYNLGDGLVTGNPATYNAFSNFTLNNPTKEGYIFIGWTGSNGETAQDSVSVNGRELTDDLEYTANWRSNTETPYTVKHWQQNLRGNEIFQDNKNYTLIETEDNLKGTTGEDVTPAVKNYGGFTAPDTKTVTIQADGRTEVNYYYTRNSYEITISKSTGISDISVGEQGIVPVGTDETSENQTNTYKYGQPITINAELMENTAQYTYSWDKWTVETPFEENDTTVSEITEQQYTFTMPAQDVTLIANGTQTINSYLQTVKVRYEKEDGTFTEYENVINENYNYGQEVRWNVGETEIYQSASIEPYTVTEAKETEVTIYRKINTNVPYVVKHWKQNIDGDTTPQNSDNYTLANTENFTGTTGQTVTANVRNYNGFISPETQTKEILSDGTLEINYYYTRRKDLSYTVKYLEKGTNKEIKNEKKVGNQTFESEITASGEVIDNIYGYNYDSVSSNTLKITTGENILNIYYTKKDSKVIVHHYIYDMEKGKYTETKLIPDIEIDGKVGDTYTTSKSSKITSNYTCIEEEPENYTGEMEEEAIEVSYYYELITPKVESSVNSFVKTEVEKDENGKYIVSKDEEIEYVIEYETKVEDYIGKVTIEITATLPAEIDLNKSDLKGGVYDPETNTIKWTEERNIDTFKNGAYTEKVEKEITIVYKEDSTLDDIGIEVEGKTVLYYPDNYLEKGGEIFVEQESINNSRVIVHHYIYDIEKEKETLSKLTRDVEIRGVVGGEYTTRKSNSVPKNYEVVNETPAGHTGKMGENPIEVNYYYKLITTNIEDNIGNKVITEVERDEDGKYIITKDQEVKYQIEYETKVEDYIGKVTIEITATLPAEIDLNKSDLKGGVYDPETNTIKWTEERNVDTFKNGVYTEKVEKEITIVYKEDTTLDDIRIKVDGRTIIYYPDDYIDKGGQISENVKYTRRKMGKITVKYLDTETNKEITNDYEITGNPGDEYETEKKEIPYYVYVKDTGNTKGKIEEEETVTYYYRKLNFNFVIENTISSITLNGEKVRISNNRLSKIEIETKKLDNTELIVKYNIKVTNDGELKGTAKVVETIPNGYELMETNGWKQRTDGTLERDVELEAGESQNLELALRWQNGDNNLGSKISIAKIESTENLANYEDLDKDDNISTTTIIVSIKTGVIVSVVIIVMIITSLLICGYIIVTTMKRMGKEPDINKIRFLMKK